MEKKQIAINIIFLIISLFLFFSLKNPLLTHLNSIEKNQKEIISELKKINKTNIKSEAIDSASPQELEKIKEDIKRLKAEVDDRNDILGLYDITPTASPSPVFDVEKALNLVTIIDKKWQKIDVLKDKISSSKIIGQIIYGKDYSYSKKENGYYYIKYLDNQYGWVNQQFVREL